MTRADRRRIAEAARRAGQNESPFCRTLILAALDKQTGTPG
jgi:hypothetical protein